MMRENVPVQGRLLYLRSKNVMNHALISYGKVRLSGQQMEILPEI